MAKRLTEPPEVAILWSAAVTSLKMEAEGPFLRGIDDVKAFIKKEYNSVGII
jgi:hypothetical protein